MKFGFEFYCLAWHHRRMSLKKQKNYFALFIKFIIIVGTIITIFLAQYITLYIYIASSKLIKTSSCINRLIFNQNFM